MLDAPEAILIGYPSAQIQAVRESFLGLSAAICTPLTAPRESFDRNAAMLLAANSFALALRTLGETAEPLRQTLPVERADAHLLRYTAYPAAGSTQLEVAYNLNDPFKWSWVLSFLALGSICVGLWESARADVLVGVGPAHCRVGMDGRSVCLSCGDYRLGTGYQYV